MPTLRGVIIREDSTKPCKGDSGYFRSLRIHTADGLYHNLTAFSKDKTVLDRSRVGKGYEVQAEARQGFTSLRVTAMKAVPELNRAVSSDTVFAE